MENLQKNPIALVKHLIDEKIITEDLNVFEQLKTIEEILLLLRESFKKTYPNMKIKVTSKSIHYAKEFNDEHIKEVAYILDDLDQYLSVGGFMDHDDSVDFFNDRITEEGFKYTPISAVDTMVLSLMPSKCLGL